MNLIKENFKEITTLDKVTDIVVFEKGSNVPKRIKTSLYNGNSLSWRALLTQENTDAPIIKEVHNSLGIVWTEYDTTGSYFIKSNGLFTQDKTVYWNSQNYSNVGREITYLYYIDSSTLGVETIDNGLSANDILLDTTFVVEVYP